MPTPAEFVRRYHTLKIRAPLQASTGVSPQPTVTHTIQLRTYFLMNWATGSAQLEDYEEVTGRATGAGATVLNQWFRQHRDNIRTAAMGKGAPQDYELALEWAVRCGDIPFPNQQSIQQYCNQHLGIDCSGFVTNYLCAAGKRTYGATLVRNTSARSYYDVARAVNDPAAVRQGDLLVWMSGSQPLSSPGHVAVVQSYASASMRGGNMEVCEATGAGGANPKVLCSRYAVTRIFDRNSIGNNQVMILEFSRHGSTGSRACVIRV